MKRLRAGYFWFKLALVVGSLLGVLLLVESATTYYQVSRRMVIAELTREAERQVNQVAREAFQFGPQDLTKLQPALDELHQEQPGKIAWIRILDSNSLVIVQTGNPAGEPHIPQRSRFDRTGPPPTPDIRSTPGGRVLVSVAPLRARGRFGDPAFRFPPDRPQGANLRAGPRFMEIALYLSSANATFRPLLTNLIVNSTAALGLVASMIFIWLRFPHYMRGKQLEQQTELARRVQTDLLPPPNLAFQNLDFAAQCVPAWQVGGDFYDVFTAPDGRIAIVLGDVSGKGLPASVVVGLLLGAIRASDWLEGSEQHEHASRQLSELLRTRTSIERFASLFWCYYEPGTRALKYVNAGHLPPMVVSKNGHGEPSITRLEEGGPVLGVVRDVGYRQGSAVVSDGGLVVLYSDGVVEAANSADEQFGEERLQAVIRQNAHRSSAEIRDEILNQVNQFLGKERAQDDLTLVVARLVG